LKIIQIIQKKQLRGAETFALQLSKELVKRGHQVKIVVLQDGEVELDFPDVDVLHINAKSLFDINSFKKLASIIRDFKPDWVQANAGDTMRYAVFSRLVYGWKAPIIFRNASVVSQYIKNPIKKIYYLFLLKRVDQIISVSEVSMRDYVQMFPFVKNKIQVIPIGIETEVLDTETESPEDRESICRGDGYILHVGGFTFEKNHEGLLRIFQMVLKKKPEVQLVLAGDGPLFTTIQDKVKELGLESNVQLLGRRTDVASLMKHASMLVLPSIIEGLPGVLLEAMYCRVPVIANNVGAIPDLLAEGRGIVVEKGDEEDFANAVIQQLDQLKSEAHLEGVRGYVKEMYSMDKVVSSWLLVVGSLFNINTSSTNNIQHTTNN
jgi:glycosyltransferase involved in cell wall biosynthesis